MDWITDRIAIGSWDEPTPPGAQRIDCRLIPDHVRISPQVFRLALGLMAEALDMGQSVFVHCIGGVSRSPTIVAAWLCMRQGMSQHMAWEVISRKRPIIQPHPAQIASLSEFLEREL